jgi:hypothetical protein
MVSVIYSITIDNDTYYFIDVIYGSGGEMYCGKY